MNSLYPKQTVDAIIAFLKTSFAKSGFEHAVIAVSGGVDSSTCLALTVRALEKENVYPVLLPYGEMNAQGTKDARMVSSILRIPKANICHMDITPLVDPIVALDPGMDRVRRGNVMARVRMIVLFDQAKKRNALVVGTENKSEHLLGYFTRFGDEASDIEPLRNLYKTQVYELAKYLGIPEKILARPPTAGLWEGQTDEGEFGFGYKEADEVLKFLYDEKRTPEALASLGFRKGTIVRIQEWIKNNIFKSRLPITYDPQTC